MQRSPQRAEPTKTPKWWGLGKDKTTKRDIEKGTRQRSRKQERGGDKEAPRDTRGAVHGRIFKGKSYSPNAHKSGYVQDEAIRNSLNALAESLLPPEEQLESAVEGLLAILDEAGYDVYVESVEQLLDESEELLASLTEDEAEAPTSFKQKLAAGMDKARAVFRRFASRAVAPIAQSSVVRQGKKAFGAEYNTPAHQQRVGLHAMKQVGYHDAKIDKYKKAAETEEDPEKLKHIASKISDHTALRDAWRDPTRAPKEKARVMGKLGSRSLDKGQPSLYAFRTGAK